MPLADDGLPVSEVGEWASEKHDRLERYVDIARGVRKQFVDGAGATYLDLYSGPGRSLTKAGELIHGSPLVAALKAREGGASFNRIPLCDSNPEFLRAAEARLVRESFQPEKFEGRAEDAIDTIVASLNRYALHFAFLDPFNLGDLPFSIIQKLAGFNRMDMLIHLSVQDLNRNLRLYMDQDGGPLDRLAPGWRDHVNPKDSDKKVRAAIFNHWLSLIRALDMKPSEGIIPCSSAHSTIQYPRSCSMASFTARWRRGPFRLSVLLRPSRKAR